MTPLWLVFIGGLLGSAHCVGMCGGFALLVGSGARRPGAGVARQLLFSAGRIFTYAAIGATAGFAGLALSHRFPPLIHAQAVLALLAGCLLIVQGLISAGVMRRAWIGIGSGACPLHGLLGAQLGARRPWNYFLAGVFTGLLPCGLVYAYLALAAATGTLLTGLATMVAFGLGTVPMMVAFGSGSAWLTVSWRTRVLKVAAWCVVFTGLLSLARGFDAWHTPSGTTEPSCPLCRAAEQ